MEPARLTASEACRLAKRYREDREPSEPIFARRAIAHFALDTDEVYLATRLAGQKTTFLPFNRNKDNGKGNPPGAGSKYATSYLWEDVWQRDNWLDILRRFVHVSKDDTGERSVIFPRFHQWDAVLQLLAHARLNGAGHNYLIEHSAGSGKNNHRLARSSARCAPRRRQARLRQGHHRH